MLKTFAAVVAAVVFAPQATASTITWGLATDTTGPSSVSTAGRLVKAFDSGGAGTTVNGVPFAAGGTAGDDVNAAIGLYTFDQFDDRADLGAVDVLLRTGAYADSIGSPPSSIVTTVTLTNVLVGSTYELQVFFMDQRNSWSSPPGGCPGCADRFTTLTSGSHSVTLDADPQNTSAAPFGQFVVGSFTADSTTQTFDISGGTQFDLVWGGPISNRQVNAWQLRAIAGVVPEPAAYAMLLVGLGLVGIAAGHRKSGQHLGSGIRVDRGRLRRDE